MDVSDRPFLLPSDIDLYTRALDKILRDTEDGRLFWSLTESRTTDDERGDDRYSMYTATTPNGSLVLHGSDESARAFEASSHPLGIADTRKGEARLYLTDGRGRRGPFPPVHRAAFQPVLDNLLTAVRLRTETPEAEAFARRYLGDS